MSEGPAKEAAPLRDPRGDAHPVDRLSEGPVIELAKLPSLPDAGSEGGLATAWWLARGHLQGRGGERFLGLVALISIVGVTVGVALLICVLAVMSGFEIDLRDKILGQNAHVVVMKYGGAFEVDDAMYARVEAVPHVVSVAPFTYAEVMLRSRFGTSGVVLKGLDPVRTAAVTEVRDQLTLSVDGPLETAEARAALFSSLGGPVADRAGEEPLPGIVLGDQLMADLQVLPGDVVQAIDPVGKGGGVLGVPVPSFQSFRVVGAFHTGMYEYDTKWVYTSIPASQEFLGRGPGVTGLELRVDAIDDVDAISREVEEAAGYSFYARHWKNLNTALFEAMALEKVVMSLIFGMIIAVAGLLIVSNLYTMVLTQRKEISILKAMGASGPLILRVYVFIGVFIGGVGAVVGTVLGLAGCEALRRYEFPLETDVYIVTTVPVQVQPLDVAGVALTAFLVCLGATLYPAMRAAHVDPIEGLRQA